MEIINYNNRIFTAKSNSENGEVNAETIFKYYQEGEIFWGEYSGGEIVKGNLVGKVLSDGILDFHYQHINVEGEVRIGKCISTPRIVGEKLELDEEWQWLNGDMSKGSSVIKEL